MREKEPILNPEDETRAEATPTAEAGGQASEQENQPSPEEALARFSREIAGRFGVPEPEAASTEASEEAGGELKSAFDVAMEHVGEPSDEEVAAQKARSVEQGAGREQRVVQIAGELLQQRMDGKISYKAVDKFLTEQGIQPWTPESAQVMEAWDRVQAGKVYEQTAAQFEKGISLAQEQIDKLAGQIKKTNYKGKIATLEGALVAHEAKIKELEAKKGVFAFLKLEAPVAVVSEPAPEPEPRSVGAAAVRDSESGALAEDAEKKAPFEFQPGQELWYRRESGDVRHAWVRDANEGGGNNLVLEERDAEGKVITSHSASAEDLEGQLLTSQEVEALTGEQEDSEPKESVKLEKGVIIQLPDGEKVQIIKKRLLRDSYLVANITPQGMITDRKLWHNLSGNDLRAGSPGNSEPAASEGQEKS